MARTLVGQRIREHRKAQGWTQAALAAHLAISPSYLNLIESDRRHIAGALLKRIADALGRPLDEFDGPGERRLVDELGEIAADAALASLRLAPEASADLVARHPRWAQALVALHRSNRQHQRALAAVSDRLSGDPRLTGAVHSMLSNLTAIRSASEILESIANLEVDERARFVRIIAGDSRRMSEVAQALASYLASGPAPSSTEEPKDDVNGFFHDNANYFPTLEAAAESMSRELGDSATPLASRLADWLRDRAPEVVALPEGTDEAARQFALARAAAGVAFARDVAAVVDRSGLAETARPGAERMLVSYVAAALVMPYERLRSAAEAVRYDIELLALRFGASVEQVCHRLVTLRRPGATGIPFGFMRTDPAGYVSKRFGLPGLALPRYGTPCPLWAAYAAFRVPGTIVRQLVELPGGERFIMFGRTVQKGPRGFGAPPRLLSLMLFCDALHADRTVYGDGLDLRPRSPALPVGQSCRTCPRRDCAWRQELPVDDARPGVTVGRS